MKSAFIISTLHKKIKFYITDFSSKNNQIETAVFVTLAEEILMENFIFLSNFGQTCHYSSTVYIG